MIPKKIHYCWFGKKQMPLLYQRCIDSWRQKMPEYEVILWNETNTELNSPFLKNALKRNEWAFISDYIRMRVLFENGGIYLDSDVEVIKDFTSLLNDKCFLGYESKDRINSGVIACTKGHKFPKLCMEMIDKRFDAKKPYLIAPEVASLVYNQMEVEDNTVIYPEDYFYPYNPYDPERPCANFMYQDITENTYGVHHWGKSWKQSILARIMKKVWK